MQTLDLAPFEKAIHQLKESLDCYHSDIVQTHPRLIVQLRAAAIQAFEFTYELSWKMLKRHLDFILPSLSEVKELSFSELIRTGCEYGLLLSDLKAWKNFREKRSITSHTYDEDDAVEVFESIPAFLKEAEYLLQQMKTNER